MNNTIEAIPNLDRKGLREFALLTGVIIVGLFGLFFPWLLNLSYPIWPWAIFALLSVWALAAPSSLKPVYWLWMRFGLLLSKVTTPIIMGAVFFLVIVPAGVLLRLLKPDPMARNFDGNAKSYRVPSRKAPKANLEKPF